jgi:radical SAM protein with 4Fe4S-binding SPASM domain
MRFEKIYVEISNLCNLKCSFCPGTKRPGRRMSVEEFSALMPKLRPYTEYLYFHLMGEPLCHPNLQEFFRIAGEHGFRVILTTNGTLLPQRQELLLQEPALHKINISLHAFEANVVGNSLEDYVHSCLEFGKLSAGRKIVVYRLWNQGGQDALNEQILRQLHAAFPGQWEQQRQGIKIAERTFLEYGDKFDWPDLSAQEGSSRVFCYGLRDQLGVLCDGTVVPCCLDHEGDISLGNVFRQDLEEILDSPRAKRIYDGFSHREAMEPLCRRCGYARRFS